MHKLLLTILTGLSHAMERELEPIPLRPDTSHHNHVPKRNHNKPSAHNGLNDHEKQRIQELWQNFQRFDPYSPPDLNRGKNHTETLNSLRDKICKLLSIDTRTKLVFPFVCSMRKIESGLHHKITELLSENIANYTSFR